MSGLLVVDWDFFTPVDEVGPQWELYDWSHAEAGKLYTEILWPSRAVGFLINDLPLPALSGEQFEFWDRFHWADTVQVFYHDSNSQSYTTINPDEHTDVWLYDAHHDSGYHGQKSIEKIDKEQRVTCEDWMLGLHMQYDIAPERLHVRYPQWKTYVFDGEPEPPIAVDRQFDDGGAPLIEFDTVSICRSSAWTPPWHDRMFQKFVDMCPADYMECLDDDDLPPREWNEEIIQQELDARKRLRQMMEEKNAGRLGS